VAVFHVALATVLVAASASSVASPSLAHAASNVANAWGFNEDGELGDGTTRSSDVPVEVSGLHGVRAIASGTHHSLALLDDGTVMAWGMNSSGQLGNGTTQKSDLPVPVSGLSNVVAVAAGEDHSLALLNNGTVMAWGMNSSGQLGDGGTTNSEVPVAVRGLSKVVAVSAGGSFSLALLTDGTVMAWGEAFHGQLGDGGMEDSDIPVPVRGPTGVSAISAGLRHGLALLSDGTVMAWGDNQYGQLGDRTETQRDVPVPVSGLTGVGAISAGKSQSLAVVVGGAVVAWGDNEKGQLGDGSHTGPEHCGTPPIFACSKAPITVSGLSGVKAISAGGHSLALLANGAVMAWGPNNVGQLGDGSGVGPEACSPSASACSTIPVLSSTSGAVSAVSAGAEFSLALGTAPPGPLPELGRCVKVASGGSYRGTTPRCLAPSSRHNGHFQWMPGPGPKANFKGRLIEPQLETVGRSKLNCLVAVLEGEYTGTKTEAIRHLTLEGCLDVTRNASCQSDPLEEGVIETSLPLEGDLGFVTRSARLGVGWEVKPRPPATSLASFDCGSGSSAVAVALQGSVIARATPIDEMGPAFELRYKQSGGQQVPEFFASGERHVLTLATTPLMGEPTAQQVGLSSAGLITDEEALEIKAKV
jgi:alpha-tubulin suppressor-like RCC1 family protein